MRKVETLPGGGQANTFYDYIGPSPVKVWGSNEEFTLLQTVRRSLLRKALGLTLFWTFSKISLSQFVFLNPYPQV